MSITVNTNMSSLICQGSLNRATNGMNTALQRMSTGLRINSAKDDAAGMAISSKLDTKLSSYAVAQDNVQMGSAMLDTATGALSTMGSMIQRLRDLSEQAANGTYGDSERAAMQAEADALAAELLRDKNTTEFNGINLLKGQMNEVDSLKFEYGKDSIVVDATNVVEIKSGAVVDGQSYILNIDDGEALQAILQGNKSGTTTLATDVDLTGIAWTAVGTYNDDDDYSHTFQGIFDGNGHTISNLSINTTTDKQGLFGAVGDLQSTDKTEIKNVNLENVNITGGSYIGSLIGMTFQTMTENCTSSGTVTGNGSYVGGLIGDNNFWSPVTNCSSSCNIVINGSTRGLGGLIGWNDYSSTITNCSSSGKISGNGTQIGGLVGYNAKTNIENCYTTSEMTSTSTYIGSLVGNVNTTNSNTTNCYYDSSKNGGMLAQGSSTAGVSYNLVGTTGVPNESAIPKNEVGTHIKTKSYSASEAVKVNLQVGIENNSNSVISVTTGLKIDDFSINLSSEKRAQDSLLKCDRMLEEISSSQVNLGATSNRLESVMEFQNVQMNALTSASSLIKDADIAKESASYIKNQILQQTTSTLLATANQNPSIALSLV